MLWKHSVYGLTPNIGSAHHLLVIWVQLWLQDVLYVYNDYAIKKIGFVWLQLFAKQHNNVKLLVEIMNLVKKNDLILQPGTADIVFRYKSSINHFQVSPPLLYLFVFFFSLFLLILWCSYLFVWKCNFLALPLFFTSMVFLYLCNLRTIISGKLSMPFFLLTIHIISHLEVPRD